MAAARRKHEARKSRLGHAGRLDRVGAKGRGGQSGEPLGMRSRLENARFMAGSAEGRQGAVN